MKKKFDLKNIDSRKVFGTVIGGIFFIYCILFFTYAYYVWESDETNVTLGIDDDGGSTCTMGESISVQNIGPVLDYNDGVAVYFSISSGGLSATDLKLDITSMSDNLKVDYVKWKLLVDRSGGTSYEEILNGDFSGYGVGTYDIATLNVVSGGEYNYKFIVYIDGTVYNDPNIQNNSLAATLEFGECGGGKTYLDYEYYMPYADILSVVLVRDDGVKQRAYISLTPSNVTKWDKSELFAGSASACTANAQEIWCVANGGVYHGDFDSNTSLTNLSNSFSGEYFIDLKDDLLYVISKDGVVTTLTLEGVSTQLDFVIPTSNPLKTCGVSFTGQIYCVYENGQFGYVDNGSFVVKGTDNLLKNATTIGTEVWFDGATLMNANTIITYNENIVYNTKFIATTTTAFSWFSATLPAKPLVCTGGVTDGNYVFCLAEDGFLYQKGHKVNTWIKTNVTIADVS